MNNSPARSGVGFHPGIGFIVGAMLLAGLCTLGGCRAQSDRDRLRAQKIVAVGHPGDPLSLDPNLTEGIVDFRILSSIYEGLVRTDPATLQPRPGVASRWRVSADGRTWTFDLREDAQWSDGRPVVAADFVNSMRRWLNPKLASESAFLWLSLEGAREYNSGKATDFERVGIRALGEKTLALTTVEPMPHLLQLASWFYPIRNDIVVAKGALESREKKWVVPGETPCNGPFVFNEYRHGSRISLRKNPRYWRQAEVKIEGVHFIIFEDASAEERAFRAGQIHIATSLPSSRARYYSQQRSPEFRLSPINRAVDVVINVQRSPVSDRLFRQALAQSVKRDDVVRAISGGGETALRSYVPPNLPDGYKSIYEQKEDVPVPLPALAVLKNKVSEGREAALEILVGNAQAQVVAEVLQQSWKKSLGVELAIVRQDERVVLQRLRQGDFTLAITSWSGGYPAALSFLDRFTSSGQRNDGRWANAEYNRLIAAGRASTVAEERVVNFQRAEAILLEEVVTIPLFRPAIAALVAPEITGWIDGATGGQRFDQLEFDRR